MKLQITISVCQVGPRFRYRTARDVNAVEVAIMWLSVCLLVAIHVSWPW